MTTPSSFRTLSSIETHDGVWLTGLNVRRSSRFHGTKVLVMKIRTLLQAWLWRFKEKHQMKLFLNEKKKHLKMLPFIMWDKWCLRSWIVLVSKSAGICWVIIYQNKHSSCKIIWKLEKGNKWGGPKLSFTILSLILSTCKLFCFFFSGVLSGLILKKTATYTKKQTRTEERMSFI